MGGQLNKLDFEALDSSTSLKVNSIEPNNIELIYLLTSRETPHGALFWKITTFPKEVFAEFREHVHHHR